MLRPPTGLDDLLLCETPATDTALAVARADRLAEPADGRPLDAAGLCVADLDVLVLRLQTRATRRRGWQSRTARSTGCSTGQAPMRKPRSTGPTRRRGSWPARSPTPTGRSRRGPRGGGYATSSP